MCDVNIFDEQVLNAKIMKWDKVDFSELVNTMTEEDLNYMSSWLNQYDVIGSCDFDFDWYDSTEEAKAILVRTYIQRWLFCQIDEGTRCGTRELFDIVMAI